MRVLSLIIGGRNRFIASSVRFYGREREREEVRHAGFVAVFLQREGQ